MELIIIVAVAIGLGFLTEYLGKQKGQYNCFWYGFLLGVIGVIIVLCLKDKSSEIPQKEETNIQNSNKYDDIAKLQQLKDKGAITEAEFEREKSKLLN